MATTLSPSLFRPKLLLLAACVVVGGIAATQAPAQTRAGTQGGTWDLSFEKGNRRCRLSLRPEDVPGGHMVAMPAGCHHAFPLLSGVSSWSEAGGDHVLLQTPTGATVLDFGPRGGPSLQATFGEDADTYVLTPADPAVQQRLVETAAAAAAAAADTAPPAVATAPVAPVVVPAPGGGVLVDASTPAPAIALPSQAMLPPISAAEVAGNYAVLRQNRDTGCMVTLEDAGSHPDAKAKLAPACRDQGIVIFDPIGWALAKGELILTAKRGHKTALTRRPDLNWATAPAKGVALVLKRL